MRENESIRAFVAIKMPRGWQVELGRCVEQLRALVPAKSVRWVRVENMHLTLRFLGNVATTDIDRLKSALSFSLQSVKAFDLCMGLAGCFPTSNSPRVLWMGVEGAMEALHDVQARVAEASANWGKPEDHQFHPHLTLGRVTTSHRSELSLIGGALAKARPFCAEPWNVVAVHLIQSGLAPGSSHYMELATFPLNHCKS